MPKRQRSHCRDRDELHVRRVSALEQAQDWWLAVADDPYAAPGIIRELLRCPSVVCDAPEAFQALAWARGAHGIILAGGGGALGVKLGDALHQDGTMRFRPELGLGEEADVDYMQSTVGLIWRALVLWMFLVLVVTVAHSLG